jgi:7,8-dihydropterin-6-yl-methyl-4-(beta-D-ribofuranosyl)aminobenzene 5'-phosphate synthase
MAATLRITILCDNTSHRPELQREHGFAVWIETPELKILFDTGQGTTLLANASALGIDLSQAETIILSHGHYDHTGGLPLIRSGNKAIPVYCNEGVAIPRYSRHNDDFFQPIGMPPAAVACIDASKNIHVLTQPTRLTDSIGLTGPIPRCTVYEDTGGAFYLDQNINRPDPVNDDCALWIETSKGLVAVTGCCHAGLINTLNYLRHVADGKKIYAIIGGFHLLHASDHRLSETIHALQALQLEVIIPCHCTGDKATSSLSENFSDAVSCGEAGMQWTIP